MRNLLVQKENLSPLGHQLGPQDDEKSRVLGMALGLDRKHRYEKMVERIYGESDAANRLLLKTLCLSAIDDITDNLSARSCTKD